MLKRDAEQNTFAPRHAGHVHHHHGVHHARGGEPVAAFFRTM